MRKRVRLADQPVECVVAVGGGVAVAVRQRQPVAVSVVTVLGAHVGISARQESRAIVFDHRRQAIQSIILIARHNPLRIDPVGDVAQPVVD